MTMKTELITGASSGIGLELARLFAKDKIHLVLVARNEEKLNEPSAELQQQGISVRVLAKDLGNDQSAKEVFEYCRGQNISIDYLVNNAGFGDFGFFHRSNWNKQQQMINLNITALTYLTWLFLPAMI